MKRKIEVENLTKFELLKYYLHRSYDFKIFKMTKNRLRIESFKYVNYNMEKIFFGLWIGKRAIGFETIAHAGYRIIIL